MTGVGGILDALLADAEVSGLLGDGSLARAMVEVLRQRAPQHDIMQSNVTLREWSASAATEESRAPS